MGSTSAKKFAARLASSASCGSGQPQRVQAECSFLYVSLQRPLRPRRHAGEFRCCNQCSVAPSNFRKLSISAFIAFETLSFSMFAFVQSFIQLVMFGHMKQESCQNPGSMSKSPTYKSDGSLVSATSNKNSKLCPKCLFESLCMTKASTRISCSRERRNSNSS